MYRLNTKIRLTMLRLSGFELYSRSVPLLKQDLLLFCMFYSLFQKRPTRIDVLLLFPLQHSFTAEAKFLTSFPTIGISVMTCDMMLTVHFCSAEYCPRMQKVHFRLTCVWLKTSLLKFTIKMLKPFYQAFPALLNNIRQNFVSPLVGLT